MRPVVFNGTVGWLHPATGGRGVVIAGAHGFEDLCSRRFLTLMARDMAAAGLPVLQFDYSGCGDAAGDHTAPALVAAWTAGIGHAVDRLKAETGVADVLVVGFRLGALLTPGAVAGRSDVAGIALLAPPPSGKAYVRELSGLSRILDAALPAPSSAAQVPFGGIEAAGFRISAETAADLRKVDWRDATAFAGRDLLLVTQQPVASHAELREHVAASGGHAVVEPFAGYAHLMSTPTANEIPQPVLKTVVGWAAARARPGGRTVKPAASAPAVLKGDGFDERPVVLGPAPEICGVLCLPPGAEPSGDAALIVNSGAIPHIGWARGAVDMARTMARRGIASLRIDLPGLGQSGTPDEERLFLYDVRARDDITRIIDWLEIEGFAQVSAVGMCAGAYQIFHAARRDHRIVHLSLVNPLCFAWDSTYALDLGLSNIRDNARSSSRLAEAEAGKTAETPATRAPSLRPFLSKLARSTLRLGLETAKSAFATMRHVLGGQSVERWMRTLTESGTRVLVVCAEGDRSLEEIARHFGPGRKRLERIDGVAFAVLEASDHTLTPAHARAALVDHVIGFMAPGTALPKSAIRTRQPGEPLAASNEDAPPTPLEPAA